MTGDQQIQAMELAFPFVLRGARPKLTEPAESGGPWSLEVKFGKRTVVVEWTRAGDFTASLTHDDAVAHHCDDPDERFEQGTSAFEYALKLLGWTP